MGSLPRQKDVETRFLLLLPPAVTAVPLPTLENNEQIPLELPCKSSRPQPGIMLRSFQPRSSQVQLNSWGLRHVANMFQSHRQEQPESIVSRNQISLIPEFPHPDPTATACQGMVSPSPLLTSLPGQA